MFKEAISNKSKSEILALGLGDQSKAFQPVLFWKKPQQNLGK